MTTFKSSFTKGQYSLDLNNNIEQLKEIMNAKGYRIDQKQNYDTFIVWDIEWKTKIDKDLFIQDYAVKQSL